MKIYNYDEICLEVSMDFLCIDIDNAIYCDDSIMLPYNNESFLLSIRMLVNNIIVLAGISWKEPDFERSKAYFYISRGETKLVVEVYPKQYSAKEKHALLSVADNDEKENGRSAYFDLLNMFDDIDEILNCNCPVGEIETYRIELSEQEKKELLSVKK